MNHKFFNIRSSVCWGVAAFAALLVVAGRFDAQPRDFPAYIKPNHTEVIKRWLASSPRRASLRVATDRDCRNKEGLAVERQENRSYQPYYAVGDFNHDGRDDFAVAFVNDRKRQSNFSFAVFNGPFPGTGVAAYFNQDSDLSEMGFSWQQGQQNFLLLGEFQSDFCVIFKPRGKSYRAQDCLGD
ncbi:MAG: hypothetical protein ACT4OT_08130 [Acidobacteriota bacterium]